MDIRGIQQGIHFQHLSNLSPGRPRFLAALVNLPAIPTKTPKPHLLSRGPLGPKDQWR